MRTCDHWLRAARPHLHLSLQCRCGHVHGVASGVSPFTGFRFVCYCHDCQAFARFLGRPDVLDAAGGTDIFQMAQGRVKLTAGTDAVRCLSLSRRVFRPRIENLGWWLRGFARPNPFFDDRTGAPRSVPAVLTPSERAALY